MPARTYTGIDLINVTHGPISDSGNVVASAIETGNAGVTVSGGGGGSFPDQGAESSDIVFLYEILANLDFSLFPTIPENALISRVEVKIDGSISGIGTSAAGGSNASTSANGTATIKAFRDAEEMTDLRIEDTDTAPGNGSASVSLSAFDHYTQEQVFDYSGAPITKAQFEALFTNLQFTVDCNIQASASQIID